MTDKTCSLRDLDGIDYADIVERFAGNESLYVRIAAKFINDTSYSSLVYAMESGNTEEGYRHAHTLKGTAGNLSFDRVYQVASKISDALHANNLTAARAEMDELSDAYAEVMESLKILQTW